MALTAKQAQLKQLHALRQVGKHIGMYGTVRIEPILSETNKYECLIAVMIISEPNQSITAKTACALILDYYVPEWRDIIPKSILGYVLEREDKRVKEWRTKVLERDGHKCVECGSSERLEVHHIAHWSEFPEARIDVNNGTTLCNGCHAGEHEGSVANLILSRR